MYAEDTKTPPKAKPPSYGFTMYRYYIKLSLHFSMKFLIKNIALIPGINKQTITEHNKKREAPSFYYVHLVVLYIAYCNVLNVYIAHNLSLPVLYHLLAVVHQASH